MNSELFQCLHDGALVITPNNRLAVHLLQTYDRLYRETQNGPLPKPLCFSYETWLLYLFNQLTHRFAQTAHPILLSPHQQRYLWLMILQQHQEEMVSAGLLEVIQEAWRRCIFWQIAPVDPALQQTTHTRRFQKWFQAFQQFLDTHQATTIELIPQYLINTKHPIQSRPMIWACFDEFTPVQTALQKKLREQNCPQLFEDYQEKPIDGYCFPATNQQDELQQAIMWAHKRLAQGDQHVAIIIPDLQKQIQTVQSVFAQHFPQDLYNISYGKRLLDYPIIRTALHWLALDLQHCNAQQIRVLLHAPFLKGGHSEFVARSQILQDSLIMKAQELAWHDFLTQIKSHAPCLYACLQEIKPYPKNDSPFAWTTHFKERLRLLGFPGDAAIDSTTYQCLNRFHLLLDDFMSLNVLTTVMSAEDAIQSLRDLASNVLFQIQKPATPVTILGILEASGCRFDSIWVMGLTDQCLPQKTKFSPFLPISMQKKLIMPHTDAQREFKRAQWVLQRLGYASTTIVYSYPQTVADQPQLASAMIQHYPVYVALPLNVSDWLPRAEVYQENYCHPPRMGSRFSGGTALLASQAKCPFQAFAAHRLKIKPALTYTDGLDLSERGQILHQIMETLWRKLKCQAQLLQLSSEQLAKMVQDNVDSTLQSFIAMRPAGLAGLSQEVEYQRLTQLAQACLEWEKLREPFQIEALEQNYEITLAGLPLKVRVDRLDQNLLQPSKTVIDYKTSLPTTKPWREERPEAPQLLLYALLDKQITTLVFIQLKAGRMTLQGLSATPNDELGMQNLRAEEAWSTYQQHWETQLTLLASEIQQGYCEPKPKRSSICQNCSFHSLCRVC